MRNLLPPGQRIDLTLDNFRLDIPDTRCQQRQVGLDNIFDRLFKLTSFVAIEQPPLNQGHQQRPENRQQHGLADQ